MLLCGLCKSRHKATHKYAAYLSEHDEVQMRSFAGEILSGIRSSTLTCPAHKDAKYSRFCYKDQSLICEKCAETPPSRLQSNLPSEMKAQLADD